MKKIINVHGMHCVSCEVLLERKLKDISGVKVNMVSYKKGILEIDYKNNSDYKKITNVIEEAGYNIIDDNNIKNIKSGFWANIVAVLVVMILLILANLFDLYKYIPDTSTLSYSGAFLVGIIASLSTCLALVGGIVIGFSKYIDSTSSKGGHLKVQIGFQLGRLIGFFLFGCILGATGQIISINLSFSSILSFGVGILLLYMGLQILGILPSLSRFGINMPKSFASRIENLGKPKYSFLAGALTFFLPCGFTQSMQILAISSGDYLVGGFIMLFFAIGTFLVLFSVGVGTSYIRNKNFFLLNKVVAGVLILFGITTISNSYNLLGVNFSSVSDSSLSISSSSGALVDDNNQVEVVEVGHNGWSMEPEEIFLEKGRDYKIIVTPTSNGKGCMVSQLIPKLSSKVSDIKNGIPITYDISSDTKSGTYDVVCGTMGMLQGKIIIK